MKKCKHKLKTAWQEVKGKTFSKSRYCRICVKCGERFIKDYEEEKSNLIS